MLHRLAARVLKAFAVVDRPAAWILLIGGTVTFIGVVVGFFAVGDAKLATLLVSADLIVGGFSAVQQAEDDD